MAYIRRFGDSLSGVQALDFNDSWTAQPCACWLVPGSKHGLPISSADHDFGRFSGIQHENPLRP